MVGRSIWARIGLAAAFALALLAAPACATQSDQGPRASRVHGGDPAAPAKLAAAGTAPGSGATAMQDSRVGMSAAQKRPPMDRAVPKKVSTAIFALGCFWGSDALYGSLPGVIRTRCGYCGGSTPDPTYHAISDYTESVEVDFDPTQITYQQLLDVFWANCNPTDHSWSRQYRSAVFFFDTAQKKAAEVSMAAEAKKLHAPIGAAIEPATYFYVAEAYHQKYRLRQTGVLMDEFSAWYPSDFDFMNSTAAARINGLLSGFGTPAQYAKEKSSLGLSPSGLKVLDEIVASHPAEGCGLGG
ncbi:MAG: peptide-methionine (S)-S-oxide reductase MsrA [Planctomycetota bacterium]